MHTNRASNRALLALAAAAMFATGCQNMGEREKGTAKGAGIGAIAGAAIGSGTGNAGKGAVIGAGVGAVVGNLWSKHMEDKRKAMEKATEGTGISVARTDDNQLKVNVPSDFSFDVGRSDVKGNMRPVLDEFARGLDARWRCAWWATPTPPAATRSTTRCRCAAPKRCASTSPARA